MQDLVNKCAPVKATPLGTAMKESYHFIALKRLAKNNMKVAFRGASDGKPFLLRDLPVQVQNVTFCSHQE